MESSDQGLYWRRSSDQGLFLEAINDQDVLRATVHRFKLYLSLMPRSRAKVWAQDIIDPAFLTIIRSGMRNSVYVECHESVNGVDSSVTDATHARER